MQRRDRKRGEREEERGSCGRCGQTGVFLTFLPFPRALLSPSHIHFLVGLSLCGEREEMGWPSTTDITGLNLEVHTACQPCPSEVRQAKVPEASVAVLMQSAAPHFRQDEPSSWITSPRQALVGVAGRLTHTHPSSTAGFWWHLARLRGWRLRSLSRYACPHTRSPPDAIGCGTSPCRPSTLHGV